MSDYRGTIEKRLEEGWRVGTLYASGDDRPCAPRLAARRNRDRRRAGRERPRPVDRRPRTGGDVERTRSRRPVRHPLRWSRAAAAARRPRPRPEELDGPGARRGRLPGRGRADPRRRDRVGALPLPRRRRPHPSPRRAALLQAPRARACRRRTRAPSRASPSRSEPAPPVPSRTASRTRMRGKRRSASFRLRSLPASARSCSSSNGIWNHLNDIAAICAGVGFAAGNSRFAALTERARRLNEALTGHRFLFDSVTVGGNALSLTACRRSRRRATEIETIRDGIACCLARAALQRLLPGPPAGRRRRHDRRRKDARRRRARGARERPDRRRAHGRSQARLRRLPAGRPRSAPPATFRHDSSNAPSSSPDRSTSSKHSSTLLSLHPTPFAGGPEQRSGSAGSRARAVPPTASSNATATDSAASSPHRLVRELAGRRPRRRRQPAARLPADQQELRALLRVCRPLMLTLLRDLRRLRRTISLPAPDRGRSLAIRHVDAGSCNGCEHELTLLSSPYHDLQRYGLGVVASPRHADVLLVTGPVTVRMREPLLTAYNAMPEPRRVAALGDCALGCAVLGLPGELAGPESKTCFRSTFGSPVARRDRKRSPRRSSRTSTRPRSAGDAATCVTSSMRNAVAGSRSLRLSPFVCHTARASKIAHAPLTGVAPT